MVRRLCQPIKGPRTADRVSTTPAPRTKPKFDFQSQSATPVRDPWDWAVIQTVIQNSSYRTTRNGIYYYSHLISFLISIGQLYPYEGGRGTKHSVRRKRFWIEWRTIYDMPHITEYTQTGKNVCCANR